MAVRHLRRPLNDNERRAAVELGVAVHYLIRNLDALKNTSIYKQSLKASANHFLTQLERHAAEMVWGGPPVEGADISQAAMQMEELTDILSEKMSQIIRLE